MGHRVSALRAYDVDRAGRGEEGVDGEEELLVEGNEVQAVANDYYFVLLPHGLGLGRVLQ